MLVLWDVTAEWRREEKGSFRDVRVRRTQNIRKPGSAWAHLLCILVQRFSF